MEYEHEHPGSKIRNRMALYGMTQAKLAHQLNTNESYLSAIINGRHAITPAMAVRLSGALDESPYYWAELQMRHDVEMAIREAAE